MRTFSAILGDLKSLGGVAALGALVFGHGVAHAADLPVTKAPPVATPFDWSGAYVGVHMGYGLGDSGSTIFDPAAAVNSHRSSGVNGGVQAGYNIVLPSHMLLGVEADLMFPSAIEGNTNLSHVITANSDLIERMEYLGTLRGRIGYAAPDWMIYVTGGFAWTGGRYLNTLPSGQDERKLHIRTGWAAGAGFEYAIAPQWSARLEYLYSHFDDADVTLGSGTRFASTLDFQTVRLGLNRKIDWFDPAKPVAKATENISGSDVWEIWGQSTYLAQGYPSFPALYSGVNSLSPNAQAKATWSNSLYLNARVWDGGEVYFNPELLQGFGLSDTVGLAGFSSGEAQKSNFPSPRFNPTRLYLRQTFGFGGEQETLESTPTQLGGKVDVSRLTIQAGKFAVLDVFDNNTYAKDPRKDFMNWSIWAPGAFDYAADKLGGTYGVAAEFNQKSWAVRAGYFLMDAESNSADFDMRIFQRGSYVLELERRYELFGKPGKVRAIAWLNSAFSGSYRETLDNPALNLDITRTRKGRTKYGYVFNVEQAVSDDLGLFGRWSWNDGKTEIMAFTDIDASLSLGASLKGASWGRPDDVIGIAGAVNALSRDHRDFLAAGGLGPLIGDGRLNYREESIIEAYYALALTEHVTLTADYQFVQNPAYNADRGPVSIFSGRLRGEF